jgi:hypothetical protein
MNKPKNKRSQLESKLRKFYNPYRNVEMKL